MRGYEGLEGGFMSEYILLLLLLLLLFIYLTASGLSPGGCVYYKVNLSSPYNRPGRPRGGVEV
jgi:hypothetical protein